MTSLKRFVFCTFLLLAGAATVPGAAPFGVTSLSARCPNCQYLFTIDTSGKVHCHEEGDDCHGFDLF